MAKTTAEKLGVREGSALLLIGAPQGWSPGPLPVGAVLADDADGPDLAVLFASDTAAVDAGIGTAVAALPLDGLLWVAYRKGGAGAGTDLNRDILQARLAGHGLTGVTLISLDDTWSGMRVRPTSHVGRR
jgi:hypothetical protein